MMSAGESITITNDGAPRPACATLHLETLHRQNCARRKPSTLTAIAAMAHAARVRSRAPAGRAARAAQPRAARPGRPVAARAASKLDSVEQA